MHRNDCTTNIMHQWLSRRTKSSRLLTQTKLRRYFKGIIAWEREIWEFLLTELIKRWWKEELGWSLMSSWQRSSDSFTLFYSFYARQRFYAGLESCSFKILKIVSPQECEDIISKGNILLLNLSMINVETSVMPALSTRWRNWDVSYCCREDATYFSPVSLCKRLQKLMNYQIILIIIWFFSRLPSNFSGQVTIGLPGFPSLSLLVFQTNC